MPKENDILFVCPECASSDIEFMVWANPNDREVKAFDCLPDQIYDGYCNSCKENIKYFNDSQVSIEIK